MVAQTTTLIQDSIMWKSALQYIINTFNQPRQVHYRYSGNQSVIFNKKAKEVCFPLLKQWIWMTNDHVLVPTSEQSDLAKCIYQNKTRRMAIPRIPHLQTASWGGGNEPCAPVVGVEHCFAQHWPTQCSFNSLGTGGRCPPPYSLLALDERR